MASQNFIDHKMQRFALIRQLYGVRGKERELAECNTKARDVIRNFIKEQQKRERLILLREKPLQKSVKEVSSLPTRANPTVRFNQQSAPLSRMQT
jgi:hypothetical protein